MAITLTIIPFGAGNTGTTTSHADRAAAESHLAAFAARGAYRVNPPTQTTGPLSSTLTYANGSVHQASYVYTIREL